MSHQLYLCRKTGLAELEEKPFKTNGDDITIACEVDKVDFNLIIIY